MIVNSLAALLLATTASPPVDGLDRIVGDWACAGHFVKSQKPLAALVTAARDPGTGALVVHHDDALGGTYKSLEVWSSSLKKPGMRASISDVSGMRWFQSKGWEDGRLDWDRLEGAVIVERFSYSFNIRGEMQIDWSSVQAGQPLSLGDSLTCRRA